MADVLKELTNLSDTLQSRNTALPKAHTLLNPYTKRIKALSLPRGNIPSWLNEQKKQCHSNK